MNSLQGKSWSSQFGQLITAIILGVVLVACGGSKKSDRTPNPFSFTAQTGVELSTVVESNAITVTDINKSVDISVTGGEYSIAGGAYTGAAGTVTEGQSVTIRLTSSDSYSTQTSATLTIGGVAGTFSVTTLDDNVPDAFSFTAQNEIAVETLVESNSVTITGLAVASPISISGGEYSIAGGEFTDAEGTIENDQTVVVRQTSSADLETTTEAVLTIGGVEGAFAVTTPGKYNFEGVTGVALNARLQTHIVEINDIGDSTPISIENGEYQLDRGAWTDQAGFIDNGQEVRVRARAGDDYSVSTTARLNIGESWGLFNVTTKEHGDFISVWKTDNSGVSGDNQITLPLEADGSYDFSVDWGDGTTSQITQWDQAEVTHTYTEVGEYTVTISGEIVGFRFNNSGDENKFIDVQHWGALRVGNNGSYFYGANDLISSANDSLDLSGTTNLENMFRSTAKFGNVFTGDISNWDVSSVNTMTAMFLRAVLFNSDISRWDVSSVIVMGTMLEDASAFDSDISQWDVLSATSIGLNDSGLSTENYSAALIAWSELGAIQDGTELDADGLSYSSSASIARELLVNDKNWDISGDVAVTLAN